MKILVTGAAGFIGNHLITALAKEHLVYALVNIEQRLPRSSSCEKIEMDLNSFTDFKKLPPQVDIIVHLAQANVPFPEEGRKMFNVNTLSTQMLLDYGRNVGITGFIFASSGSIYGSGTKPFKETDPTACPDFYSFTKYKANQLELFIKVSTHE